VQWFSYINEFQCTNATKLRAAGAMLEGFSKAMKRQELSKQVCAKCCNSISKSERPHQQQKNKKNAKHENQPIYFG